MGEAGESARKANRHGTREGSYDGEVMLDDVIQVVAIRLRLGDVLDQLKGLFAGGGLLYWVESARTS